MAMTHISRLSVKNGADSQTGLKMLERIRWSKWLGSEPIVRFCVLGQGLYDLNSPPEPEERALELIFSTFPDVGLENYQHLKCLVASVLYC